MVADTTLPAVRSVFTFLLSTVTDVLGIVIANPVLLIPIGAGLVGTGIMIFKKIKG